MSITREILEKEWHGVEIANQRLPDHIVEWLEKNVGRGHWYIKGNWGSQTIFFDDERKHFLFLMTWGQ